MQNRNLEKAPRKAFFLANATMIIDLQRTI